MIFKIFYYQFPFSPKPVLVAFIFIKMNAIISLSENKGDCKGNRVATESDNLYAIIVGKACNNKGVRI